MRSQQEIVREIVKVIKKARPTAAVDETYIRDEVDSLRTPCDPSRIYRKQNANYAKDVIKWIDDGLKLLAGRAEAFPPSMLFRQETDEPIISARYRRYLILAGFPAHEKYGVVIAGRRQLRSLKDVLAGMREECDLIIEMKVGAHGNHGHEQQRAARASGDLMDQHRLKWGYSSESSPFCTVARLLFEAMTGRYDESIARACRDVARDRNLQLAFEQWLTTAGTETSPKN